jgi:hypothetical protein
MKKFFCVCVEESADNFKLLNEIVDGQQALLLAARLLHPTA